MSISFIFFGISEHTENNNLLFLHNVQNRFSMNKNELLRPEKENKNIFQDGLSIVSKLEMSNV